MPSAVISHQAPGLFLKIKYPKRIDGTAICFGAFVPDMNVIIDLFTSFRFRNISHSLLGLLIWTVPLAIILSILFDRYIGPYFAKIAKKESAIYKPLKFFGVDDWDVLKKKPFNKRFYIIAFYSALLGGLTHILLDLPSHEYIELLYPWFLLQSPDFLLIPLIDYGTIIIGQRQFEAVLTVYQLIWFIEDIILLVISLSFLRYINKKNLVKEWDDKENLNKN